MLVADYRENLGAITYSWQWTTIWIESNFVLLASLVAISQLKPWKSWWPNNISWLMAIKTDPSWRVSLSGFHMWCPSTSSRAAIYVFGIWSTDPWQLSICVVVFTLIIRWASRFREFWSSSTNRRIIVLLPSWIGWLTRPMIHVFINSRNIVLDKAIALIVNLVSSRSWD